LELTAYGYAGAGLAYTALWLASTRMRPVRPAAASLPVAFIAAVVASAAWGWVGLVSELTAADGWPHLVTAVDTLRYALWFLFVGGLLLGRDEGAPRWLAVVGVILVCNATLVTAADWSGAITSELARRWSGLTWLALPVFGLVLVEQLFRNVPDDFRWHANPLCLGLASTFAFDLYVFSQAVLFGALDPDSVVMRGIVDALTVPLLLIAARRHGGWLGKLYVSRHAAFHTATLLLVGSYLLFVSGVAYYVRTSGGEWGRALQVGLIAVALVCLAGLLLSQTMRSRLTVFVVKNFFTHRYDYRAEWLRFTEMLSGKGSPAEIGSSIVRGMANMLESRSAALWSGGIGSADLVETTRWNMPPAGQSLGLSSPFCRFLVDTGWVIDLDECRVSPDRYGALEVPRWLMDESRFWLLVPLIIENELVGLVVLGRPNEPVVVNWEVRDLLKTAARQAAGFLARMQATEALLEIRKFDAFNRMSAFVVHDLKNIVTQLSLMLSNAKRLQDNPEFRQDMLQTVDNSLEKMRQLILQLREGDAGPGTPSGVDLVAVARRIRDAQLATGRQLRLEVVDAVATRGHHERIARVIGHLVNNAFEATPPGGSVWLRVERASGQARITVGDSGHGMSAEFVHTQLFKPFRTTKSNGMGIGAYESFQYVRELGGSISVDSELERGTVVTVLLPAFEVRPESDLQLSDAK
jgi:putative PEP-CTERM system histidine kinase